MQNHSISVSKSKVQKFNWSMDLRAVLRLLNPVLSLFNNKTRQVQTDFKFFNILDVACRRKLVEKLFLSTSSLIWPSYTIRAKIFEKVFRPEVFPKNWFLLLRLRLTLCKYYLGPGDEGMVHLSFTIIWRMTIAVYHCIKIDGGRWEGSEYEWNLG